MLKEMKSIGSISLALRNMLLLRLRYRYVDIFNRGLDSTYM